MERGIERGRLADHIGRKVRQIDVKGKTKRGKKTLTKDLRLDIKESQVKGKTSWSLTRPHGEWQRDSEIVMIVIDFEH